MSKLLRLGVSSLLLGWIAWHTDWVRVAGAFRTLRIEYWLGAVLLLVLTQVVSACRWYAFARALHFHRTISQLTGFYFIGMWFSLMLPTSVGGDVVRAWYLDAGSGRKLAAFGAVFLDRLNGVLVLLAMACVAVAVSPLALPPWMAWSVWGFAGCVALGLLALPLLARIPWLSPRKLQQLHTMIRLLRAPGVLWLTSLLSFVVQAANVVIVWLVAEGLGAKVPPSFWWVLVPMVSILTLMPVSVNGMGVREGATVLLLAPLGVSDGTALTIALLWFAVGLAVSLLGGLVYLFGKFPKPQTSSAARGAEIDHGPVDRDSDQGRTGQFGQAA